MLQLAWAVARRRRCSGWSSRAASTLRTSSPIQLQREWPTQKNAALPYPPLEYSHNQPQYQYQHFQQHSHQHHQTRNLHAFVSKHNTSLNVSQDTIVQVCQAHLSDARHKTTATHVNLRECPFCPKPTHGKLSNLYKLYIQIQSGAYFCHRCGAKGSWYDFKAHLHGGSYATSMSNTNLSSLGSSSSSSGWDSSSSSSSSHATRPTDASPLPMPQSRVSAYYSSRLLDEKHKDNAVLQYLQEQRGLSAKTLRLYGVGRADYSFPSKEGPYRNAECITFPWILPAADVKLQESLRGVTVSDTDNTFVTRRIKVRALEQKGWQRLDPAGGGWGLFGLHTVPEDAKEVILTEGEYDAMAVFQATGRPAISLPNGCRSLPVEVLPLLERFDKIYLWMDNDVPGQEGAEKFAKKLGVNRCLLVPCKEAKDANDALLQGIDMVPLLEAAKVLPHDRIVTFEDLREDVLDELLRPDAYMGQPVTSLPQLNQIIKGFRKGEMTVLTGPTGSGKTTFLGQVSLDLAEQSTNVLWGSFEIKNTRLLHKLLKQFSRNALPQMDDPNAEQKLNALADQFEGLPLHFLRFHGGSDVDEVLDAMEYAVYVNDVEHIILDNMQFMITRNVKGATNWDKFEVQDIAIEKFRKFATEHNIHLTLVVHPRKEDEAAKLNMSSFYGSAKATQEADTVLILQNDGRRKYVEVKKNRFDGTLGVSPLYFQHRSGRYTETEDVSLSNRGGGNPNSNPPPPTPTRKHWTPTKKEPEPDEKELQHHWGTIMGTSSTTT